MPTQFSCRFHERPDKILLLITNYSQLPTTIKALADALTHTPLCHLALSQLGFRLTVVETSRDDRAHLSHARTADTLSQKDVQDINLLSRNHTPFFRFAESIIIPVTEYGASLFRHLDETQLDDHLISLISRRFSPLTSGCDCPFPNHHLTHSLVTLQILWASHTHTVSLPEHISCKQLWLWLAYFSSLHFARNNDQLLHSSYSTHTLGFHPHASST